MLDFFRAGGFNMFILTALGIAILIPAVKFARNADPQRLSLIRALTTAIVFCTVVGVASGLAATCHYVVNVPEAQKEPLPYLLQGFAETMTNAMLGGGIVVITWILVAFGVRRMPADPS
jgi:ABC-type Fe3+ transport system permease subunit